MLVTYIIPVLNQEETILRAVSSALAIAEVIDGNVLVCVNKCSDATLEVVSSLKHDRISIMTSNNLLSMRENVLRGLTEVKTPYACFLSGDDWLPVDGQVKLGESARAALSANYRPVFFGDYNIVMEDVKDARGVVSSLKGTWFDATVQQQRENIIKIHLPNLNGAWIPIESFIRGMKAVLLYMPEELTSYAGDVPFWWDLVSFVPLKYISVTQVYYNGDLGSVELSGYQKRARHLQIQGVFSFYSKIQDNKLMEKFHPLISLEKSRALIYSKNISKFELKEIVKKFKHWRDGQNAIMVSSLIKNSYPVFYCYQFLMRVNRKINIWIKS